MVVSSDRLRELLFGAAPAVVDGQLSQRPMAVDDTLIFSMMEQIVRSRLRAGLTTVVDATLSRDRDRSPFAAIATDLHVPVQVVIFDLPEAQVQAQNQDRAYAVPREVVSRFCQQLDRQSRWPFTRVKTACQLVPTLPTIPDQQAIDVIGDVHGLVEHLRDLLQTLGYDANLQHPQGRKLCFLGDLVDRGPDSLAVLDLVMTAVERGHYAICGNHDVNLARGLFGNTVRSRATRETLHYLLQRDAGYQEQVRDFVMHLPTFYQYRNYVLCHGDIEWFDPLLQPGQERVYGRRRIDEDHDTDGIFRQTMPDRVLVRGHIPLTSEGDRVYSLDEGAGFGGPLVALRLPEQEKVRIPCGFDYHRRSPSFADQMESLVAEKWVKKVTQGHLSLYKYTTKAFFNTQIWQSRPEIKLARGVVVGLHGNPVNQPFPRTFNYLEQGTTLPPQTEVVAVEKLNGFLVVTVLHPYVENQVLVTCSGSFAGDYLEMAKELLYKQGLYGRVLKYLRDRPGLTLLWEAIHPQDPHIISYPESHHSLHLIGVGELGGDFWAESALDELASKLELPRPAWFYSRFQAVIDQVRSVNHEGFMIRLAETGQFALKLKSPYYLRTKFLSRMTERRSKFMFASPEKFKQELDEALWPLVDAVTQGVNASEWLAWTDVQRRDFIQSWMETFYTTS
jgi:predicted kinase